MSCLLVLKVWLEVVLGCPGHLMFFDFVLRQYEMFSVLIAVAYWSQRRDLHHPETDQPHVDVGDRDLAEVKAVLRNS